MLSFQTPIQFACTNSCSLVTLMDGGWPGRVALNVRN